nr:bifunctional DNA primase/polymerase [Streptomyces sp. SID5468]
MLDAAVRYAEGRHWEVCPGAWLVEADGVTRCSCGDPGCSEPGAHPTRPDWPGQATGNPDAVRRLWSGQLQASVLLPTGRTFDAVDVPEAAGCLALARLERMELPLGPVLFTPTRRLVFLVLPGAKAKLPDLLRALGRRPGTLDLRVHGDGDYLAAPPTRLGGAGPVRWARRPNALNRWLPDVEEMLSPLAYACGREAAARRERPA